MIDRFDLDNDLMEDSQNDFSKDLELANLLCMREQYSKALDIYNKILDKDMKNEEAYIGLLKVHSECFTKYEGADIEKDIRIIERLFPNTLNKEYASYCLDRKKHLQPASNQSTTSSNKNDDYSDIISEFFGPKKTATKDDDTEVEYRDTIFGRVAVTKKKDANSNVKDIYEDRYRKVKELINDKKASEAIPILQELIKAAEEKKINEAYLNEKFYCKNINALLYFDLGYCFQLEKRRDDSLIYYKKSLSIITKDERYYITLIYNMAGLYFDNKNYSEALKYYLERLSIKEYDAAYYYVGYCYYMLQDYEKSLIYYNTILSKFPKDSRYYPYALYNLGIHYYDGKGVKVDKVKAKSFFDEASKLGNKSATDFLKKFKF